MLFSAPLLRAVAGAAIAAVAAVIVLRIKRPDAPRPYRASLYPIAPILFIAVSASGWAG